MNYAEALAYLQGLTDYEHIPASSGTPRFDLGRVVELLARLGHPEQRFQTVHVVGTKGKGSTAAMIAGILQAAGYRTGLYSSPHLHTFRERIRFDGHLIEPEAVAGSTDLAHPAVDAVHSAHPELGRVTTFEAATAVALLSFAHRQVDWAVLEAGLGGRLDATNIVQPRVTVLTPIGLDHTAYLGDTIAAIAREKAAVIKPGVPVVSAQQRPEAMAVIEELAGQARAPLAAIGRDWLWVKEDAGTISVQGPEGTYRGIAVPLLGRHQLENAALAVAAIGALQSQGIYVTEEAVRTGIAAVRWPGRLEVMGARPTLVVDGAHNPDAMHRLREALAELFGQRRPILVLGSSVDKDLAGIVTEIVPAAGAVIVTRSRHPRAAPPATLLDLVARHHVLAEAAPDVATALLRARQLASPDDVICVTGSLFVVADARAALLGLTSDE